MPLMFNAAGLLFPGIHKIAWNEFYRQYSFSDRREFLFSGMKDALIHFKSAGCVKVYIDGSFVTKKVEPGDYDACWDMTGVNLRLLDPMFYFGLQFGTTPQKLKYFGEFYPASIIELRSGLTFLDFFQTDRITGNRKGIIEINFLSGCIWSQLYGYKRDDPNKYYHRQSSGAIGNQRFHCQS